MLATAFLLVGHRGPALSADGSDDVPEIGPCDIALYEMEAMLVARVDGVPLERYAKSHPAEMIQVATVIYKAEGPAAEIQRRYEECLLQQ